MRMINVENEYMIFIEETIQEHETRMRLAGLVDNRTVVVDHGDNPLALPDHIGRHAHARSPMRLERVYEIAHDFRIRGVRVFAGLLQKTALS